MLIDTKKCMKEMCSGSFDVFKFLEKKDNISATVQDSDIIAMED